MTVTVDGVCIACHDSSSVIAVSGIVSVGVCMLVGVIAVIAGHGWTRDWRYRV